MNRPMRLAVSGAGRVFERLYAPALRRSPQLRVVATADPDVRRASAAWPGAHAFPDLSRLLAEIPVDAVVVLSPPAAHIVDALAALERRLPVLIEKPMCQHTSALDALRSAGAEARLVPAFSRRYWSAYRRIKANGVQHALRFAIRIDPPGWAAYSGHAPVLEDIFPHVADLGRWLTGGRLEDIRGRVTARGFEATMRSSAGPAISARVDTGPAYREAVRADGRSVRAGPPGTLRSATRRATRRPDPAVEAIREMLADWAASIAGAVPEALPRFEDGAASVLALEALRYSIAAPGG